MSNPQDFARQYGAQAAAVGEKLGVDPAILLGQWGLETGWGKSVIPGTNNLGNIKDFSGKGTMATDNMTGSRDAYRTYETPDAFGQDFAGLIGRKYQSAMNIGDDATKFATELKKGGYAEDPDYVRKLVASTNLVRNSGGWGDRIAEALLPSANAAGAPAQGGMQAKIDSARKAGYSDDDIAAHLGQMQGFSTKLQKAREAGYSDADIFGHLGLTAAPAPRTSESSNNGVMSVNIAQEEPLDTNPSAARGGVAAAGFMGAIRDPLDAGAQLLVRGARAASGLIPDALGGQTAQRFMDDQVSSVDKQVRTANAEYEQSRSLAGRDGFDAARLAGNIVSPANIPAARLMGGANTLTQLAMRGAGAGAIGGALQPVVNDQKDFAASKLLQTGGGAVAGAVLSPVAARAVQYVGDQAAAIAQRLRGTNISQADIDAQILAALRAASPDAPPASLDDIAPAALSQMRETIQAATKAREVVDPAALARRADFDTLGIKPTTGQITREPMQFAQEKNLRGINLSDDPNLPANPLAQRFSEQNRALTGEFDRMGAAAAEPRYQAGNRLTKSLVDADAPYKKAVDDLYNSARSSDGRYAEIDTPAFSNRANEMLDEKMLGRFLPEDVRGLLNDVSSGRVPLNVNNMVQVDSILSEAQRRAARGGDKSAAKAVGAVRDALNDAPVSSTAGQEAQSLFGVGRTAARVRFGRIEDSPALKAALDGVDPERFVDKYIIGATTDETRALVKVLGSDRGALEQAKAQIAEYLRESAFKTNSTGDKGMAVASYQNALKRLGRDKLMAIFSPEEVARMEAVGRVGSYITTQPAGSAVNNSNTGAAMVNRLTEMAGPLARLPMARLVRDQVVGWQNENLLTRALSGQVPTSAAPAAKMPPKSMNRLLRLLAPLPVAGGQASGSSSK